MALPTQSSQEFLLIDNDREQAWRSEVLNTTPTKSKNFKRTLASFMLLMGGPTKPLLKSRTTLMSLLVNPVN